LGHVSAPLHALIVASGVVTTIPLLLFAYAAQRLRLVTLGIVQYIAPSMQFLIGLLVYHEPFDSARLQACVLIWLALLLYTADSFWAQRSKLWPVVETP
jgi:chloramphenicol-sensitive protein RarD